MRIVLDSLIATTALVSAAAAQTPAAPTVASCRRPNSMIWRSMRSRAS